MVLVHDLQLYGGPTVQAESDGVEFTAGTCARLVWLNARKFHRAHSMRGCSSMTTRRS